MKRPYPDWQTYSIAVVIPCFRVEKEIHSVITNLPNIFKHIIFIDDASPDETSKIITKSAKKDRRIVLIKHKKNLGVGEAMKSGFQKALELGAQIVVKIDGDGQMDMNNLPGLLIPLIEGQADYTKGNRFRDYQALQKMPAIRRVGNTGLSFLTKAATGYWNIFDPTNGYIAIRSSVLALVPLHQVDSTYYFETSMLANLYLLGAVVKDIPMPARYLGERSSLSVHRTLFEFPIKLIKTYFRRLFLRHLIYDFSMATVYVFVGLPLLLFGLSFGIIKWIEYSGQGISAPTGTVMLPTLAVLLGIQFLIAAIEIDLRSTPNVPLSPPL
jgi:dolichol-phosphate mannosyltransferase